MLSAFSPSPPAAVVPEAVRSRFVLGIKRGDSVLCVLAVPGGYLLPQSGSVQCGIVRKLPGGVLLRNRRCRDVHPQKYFYVAYLQSFPCVCSLPLLGHLEPTLGEGLMR